MASLEFNKIAGALLGTALVVMGVRIVAEGIFASEKPAKPGYDLPAAAEHAAGAAEAAPAAAVPLPELLAKADIAKGKEGAAKCVVCHSLEKGGAAKVGPPLYGIVGRPTAAVAGFDYTDTLKNMNSKWTLEALNGWITNAATYAKGTRMVFQEADAGKRANILVYLNSLSDSPPPLPK